jgi:hypothetical protein
VGVANSASLWPNPIYYKIENNSDQGTNLIAAIDQFNSDFGPTLQWTNIDLVVGTPPTVYVDITLSGTGGAGDVTSVGYPYYNPVPVNLNCNTDCNMATLLHEMGHIVGLYHEQTRTDRDSFVTMNYDNVIKGSWAGEFAINTQNQQLLAPYDYASVMQYPSYVDSRDGGPVIETIPPGIPLQGVEGLPGLGNQDYSAGDKEAILRLYGSAPTKVTITSNPVGLSVSVDGTSYTTPVQFAVSGSWALNTTHTLSVGTDVQTLSGIIENSGDPGVEAPGFYYTYGRWSDSTAQTHTITVAPGDGSPAFPTTAPAVATYSANFIQLVPYTETAFPTGEGGVNVSPAPQTYTGASGEFFVARQEATLTATPNPGWSFYEFNATYPYLWLPGGISANPKTFYVPDTGNPEAVNAEFTQYPVHTVNVIPADAIQNEFSDNLWAYVDSGYWNTPKSFSPDPALDGTTWNAGTSHTLDFNPFSFPTAEGPEYPYSYNTRFAFLNWSDGGAVQHTISSLPSGSTNYTATVTPQYQPATNFGCPPCGGTTSITPASTNNGFYPWGTQLTFTATPDTADGWSFAGWTFDLNGTTNPASLTAKDETLVYANFNTTNSPLTITSLSPSSAVAGASTFTLTISGTGFSSASNVVVNGHGATRTVVSSTEIQAQVSNSWVSSTGNFDVYVENFPTSPPGWNGCAVFAYDTYTVTASGSGTITPTINWTPATVIAYGSGGETVLNATTAPPDIGGFSYSATPTGGGSAVDVTGGTTSLPVGKYTLTATFNPMNPQYKSTSATSSLTVTEETVRIADGSGGVSGLAGNGTAVNSSAYPGGNMAVAIDSGGNVWSVGTGSTLLEEISQGGSTQNAIASGAGGLDLPVGIAIDGNSQIWVTNGNNSVSLFSNAGAALSPSTGFTAGSLSTPRGIAIDVAGSVWIADKGNNSVTRILGAAAPAAPLAKGAKNNTTGSKP